MKLIAFRGETINGGRKKNFAIFIASPLHCGVRPTSGVTFYCSVNVYGTYLKYCSVRVVVRLVPTRNIYFMMRIDEFSLAKMERLPLFM